MTPAELGAALLALGITPRAFAAFIGKNPRTVLRWRAGQQDIELCAVRVIELAQIVATVAPGEWTLALDEAGIGGVDE